MANSQACSYAKLPGYTGGANTTERFVFSGDTNVEPFYETPAQMKNNNTMLIAMSVSTGGLLIIIMLMLFFVKPKKRT